MNDLTLFNEGDIVAFKIDPEDLTIDKKYCVVEIREKKL